LPHDQSPSGSIHNVPTTLVGRRRGVYRDPVDMGPSDLHQYCEPRRHGAQGLIAAIVMIALLALSAHAQDDAPGALDAGVYENRPIERLVVRGASIEGAPRTRLSDEARTQALNIITSTEGSIFSAERVRDDVRRLNRLGLFQRVEIYAGLTDSGAVELVFDLLERKLVIDVQVTGNTKINDNDIRAVIDVVPGTPVDRFQIDRSARRVEDLYRSKGYFFVRVNIDEDELEDTGLVIFQVLEGERLKVSAIRFRGNEAFEARKLRREVDTRVSNLFTKGQLDEQILESDIANLIGFYRNRGYLDIRADRLIQPARNAREAIVTYLIEEGPLYTLRSIQTDIETSQEGDTPVFAPEQIAGLIGVKPGDVYAIETVERSITRVADAYGQMGYADAQVVRLERRDEEQPVVDLIVAIAEGDRSMVGEVVIQGNSLTKQKVIRRQIELKPTRPLDTTAVDRSQTRLRRLRLFNDQRQGQNSKITPQEPGSEFLSEVWGAAPAPGAGDDEQNQSDTPDRLDAPIDLSLAAPEGSRYRDVLVEVEETNTGSFDFGGAVSSDTGLIGRIALTQRNFDIADTPDSFGELVSGRAFRGAGQTFTIEAQPGNEVQTFSVSLSEPAVFESSYSASVSGFFRNRDFDEFDESRAGIGLGLGRRFGTRWTGGLNFRFNSIELSGLDPSRPTDIFEAAEPTSLYGLGVTLQRNNLDSRIRPTRGSRTSIGIEQVVGDFTFTPITLRHNIYAPIREDYLGRTTVLEVSTSVGYIPQGRDNVPTYERFYLGGQSFRGFEFRTVSPRGVRNDNGNPSDDPIGGTWQFFVGLQITQPIWEETVSGVLFIESGTVSFDPGFESFRVSAGFGFRILFPALSRAPLAFDFGFPLSRESTDEERTFTFSVDLPFN